MGRILDCVEEFDERSRGYGIRSQIKGPGRSYTWRLTKLLNQGKQGACSAFASGHAMLAMPKSMPTINNKYCFALYKGAQKIDEWPGENYSGTSILSVCKLLKQRGLIRAFYWGFGVQDLKDGLAKRPAVIGVKWLSAMDKPNKHGIITAKGKATGRHAILVNGYNAKRDLYSMPNSWGRKYGKNGYCYLNSNGMQKLLLMRGECVFLEK